MERRQKVATLFQQKTNFELLTSQELIEEEVEVELNPIALSPSFSSKALDPNNNKSKSQQQNTSTTSRFSSSKKEREYIHQAGSLRWLILLLSCFIMFGNFYAFDNPSALNRQLRVWMGDRSEVEFEFHLNLLYTVYSVPNIFLPFIVGRALDRYGSRSFLIVLSFLMCLGQAIFSAGVSSRTWLWMLVGRLIFGLGGESLSVAQSRLVTEWFLGRELGMAIGLNLSVARIGTVFNNNASPRIAERPIEQGGGVPGACWIGLVTCVFSLICTLFCIFVDSIYRPIETSTLKLKFKSKSNSKSIEDAVVLDSLNVSSLENDDEFIHPTFYLLLVLNFLSYGAVLCFNTVASAYLQVRYFPGNIFKSNWAMSVPDTTAIFLVPLTGMVVDLSGWKLWTIGLGQAALAFGHFWLAISKGPVTGPYVPLFILGIGYSTLLAIWSCVPYLVGSRCQATAYGYLTASTNLSSTLLPILVASLVSFDQSYFHVGIFFSFLAISGLAICFKISTLNSLQSLNLNSSRVPTHMVEVPTKEIICDPKGFSFMDSLSSFYNRFGIFNFKAKNQISDSTRFKISNF